MNYTILQGDNRVTLKTLADNSIDAIVTDPPYGIDFLGKSWDANTGALETYQECLRVLKPGGHILAFSAARTYHHLAVTLEQAGFEIRDQIMWIYSSGFPKSQDIGKSIERSEKKRADNALGIKRSKIESGPKTNCPKCNKTLNGSNQNLCQEESCDLREALKPADNEWAGWGTALKPAHEPIALARKPMKLSIAKNAQKWGTGALNIDATRIPVEGEDTRTGGSNGVSRLTFGEGETSNADSFIGYTPSEQGRFPSNVIGEIAEEYQKYFYCPKVSRKERHIGHEMPPAMFAGVPSGKEIVTRRDHINDIGKIADDYQKYFYCPKVSRKERHCGMEDPGPQTARERDEDGNVLNRPAKKAGASATVLAEQFQLDNKGNNHPTVKPVALMKYLIKLITPPNGIVLDPFNGSGSTGMAAVELGHEYIGCELDPAYVEIATKRIEAWYKETYDTSKELFE